MGKSVAKTGAGIDSLKSELRQLADKQKAQILARFFKTGPGDYGEGDLFLGVVVPSQRKIAGKYTHLGLNELQKLIKSPYHEERLTALLILVNKFQKADPEMRKKIFDFYLKNTRYINNWDLVDLSADKIVGCYLEDKDKGILRGLAKSASLWERRIAILSTFHFIKQGRPEETLKIAELLIADKHDLIHKAVGWMLRELGKRCGEEIEEEFISWHCKNMPRVMLRYALEKWEPCKRDKYLQQ